MSVRIVIMSHSPYISFAIISRSSSPISNDAQCFQDLKTTLIINTNKIYCEQEQTRSTKGQSQKIWSRGSAS